jgi:tetratricopeptide (TPR) repeat protein
LVLAVTVLPQYSGILLGAAAGWIVAGVFIFRGRMPLHYQKAIRHLRKNEYADAVAIMDEAIAAEPEQANHYRFRAEILRLWGKLDRARRDYLRMTELDPQSAVAFNGLAEVQLQAGKYADALGAGQRAAELAPDEWVALYNLGMIEDRLSESAQVIEHLQKALDLKVPDARHRLLIHLYLARAHARLGDGAAAQAEVIELRKHSAGLREWEKILASDQAETLRAVIGDDVQAAEALMTGSLDVTALAGTL